MSVPKTDALPLGYTPHGVSGLCLSRLLSMRRETSVLSMNAVEISWLKESSMQR